MRTVIKSSGEAATDSPSNPIALNLRLSGPDAPSKGVRYRPMNVAGLGAASVVGFVFGTVAVDAVAGFVRSLRD